MSASRCRLAVDRAPIGTAAVRSPATTNVASGTCANGPGRRSRRSSGHLREPPRRGDGEQVGRGVGAAPLPSNGRRRAAGFCPPTRDVVADRDPGTTRRRPGRRSPAAVRSSPIFDAPLVSRSRSSASVAITGDGAPAPERTRDRPRVPEHGAGDAVLGRQPAGADRRPRPSGQRERTGVASPARSRAPARCSSTRGRGPDALSHGVTPSVERRAPDAFPDDHHDQGRRTRDRHAVYGAAGADLRVGSVEADRRRASGRSDRARCPSGIVARSTPVAENTIGTRVASCRGRRWPRDRDAVADRDHARSPRCAAAIDIRGPSLPEPGLDLRAQIGRQGHRTGTAVATWRSSAQLSPTQNAVRATAGAPTSANATTSTVRRRPDPTSSRLPPGLSFGAGPGTLVGQ